MGVENQDVASPDTSAPEIQDATKEAPQEASQVEDGAATSDAPTDGETPESEKLLSVVRDAVKPKDPVAASPAEDSDPDTGAEADAEGAKDDYSDVPFHNHPRFKQLVQEKNGYKAGHEQFNQITSFLSENGIEVTEAAEHLSWLALRKQDPAKAWAQIKPQIQQLLVDAGEVLPPDLRDRVAKGELTQQAAMLVARERAERTKAERALEARETSFSRSNEAREAQARREAVASWETARRKDPDYAHLEPKLLREVQWLKSQEGTPKTIDGIREQLDRAWKAVKAEVRAAQPRKPAVTPVTGGRVAGSPTPAPKNTLDLIRQVRAAG